MPQQRRYKNPPIIEALCEFRFEGATSWDDSSAARVKELLGSGYEGGLREQRVARIEVKSLDGERPNLNFSDGLERIQIASDDRMRIVAVGPELLSVHMLRPYHSSEVEDSSGWIEFRQRISKALESYWVVVEPAGVVHIGMRYINKLVVSRSQVNVEDYLLFATQDVPNLPLLVRNFFNRVEREYDDGVRLILSQSSTDAPQGSVGFLLDLDVIWDSADSIDCVCTMSRVEDLREREREAFEAVITEKARELFDAD